MSATDLLTAIHCNLDDGEISGACRDIQTVRGMAARGELTADESDWLSSLGSLLAACLGSM